MRRFLSIHCLFVFALLCASCSGARYEPGTSSGYARSEQLNLPRAVAEAQPWEIMPTGRLMTGEPLRSVDLIAAEELIRQGQRRAALDAFVKASKIKRKIEEQELIAYRVASLELSLGMEKRAISTLSRYFKATGRTEQEVPTSFALVFAYAFGADHQLDQSIAWFLRARTASGTPALGESVENGLRGLLRSVSPDELEAISSAWRSDSFVYGLVAQERQLRTQPQYGGLTGRRFWEQGSAAQQPVSPVTNQIGVILPLTGHFSGLGTAARQGIELAAGGEQANMLFRDDTGNSSQTEVLVRELYGQAVSFILGPLITESASRAAQVARELGVPILTFAKGGDFEVGSGAFRLGPTVSSQVESLLEAVNQDLGIRRIALVYPNDLGGEEFAVKFKEELSKYGLQPVFERAYPKGDMSSFVQIASELDSAGPEAVFFPDALKVASRFFPNLRKNVRPLGTVAWDNLQELQQSRTAMEGAVFVSPFFAQSSRPEIQKFITAYQQRYGSKPDFLAAQGFDAATLVMEAQRRRADDRSLLPAFLSIENYDGLTGMIRVDGSGEISRRFAVVSLESEGLKPVQPRGIITEPREQELQEDPPKDTGGDRGENLDRMPDSSY